MRRLVITTLLLGLAAGSASAQITAQKQFIATYEQNRTAMHELLADVTPEQWAYKAAADRWSITEIVEHIVLNEQLVARLMREELRDIEPTEKMVAQAEAFEEQLAAIMRDRGQRFPAPTILQPTGAWAGGEEIMGAFDAVRDEMIAFFEGADFDLRAKVAKNPIIQRDLDVHAWGTVAVEHCKRHMKQIEEVMADEGFPQP